MNQETMSTSANREMHVRGFVIAVVVEGSLFGDGRRWISAEKI